VREEGGLSKRAFVVISGILVAVSLTGCGVSSGTSAASSHQPTPVPGGTSHPVTPSVGPAPRNADATVALVVTALKATDLGASYDLADITLRKRTHPGTVRDQTGCNRWWWQCDGAECSRSQPAGADGVRGAGKDAQLTKLTGWEGVQQALWTADCGLRNISLIGLQQGFVPGDVIDGVYLYQVGEMETLFLPP
jgi:hypothetical protein